MKRSILTFYILFSGTVLFAQGSYYNDLDTNRRCQNLKDALYTLVNTGAVSLTYEQAFNFMADYDIININGENFIWDIYSHNPDGTQPYTYKPGNKCNNESGGGSEGLCWNREHVFPSSWFGAGNPMYGDFHNLLPTDGYVNNQRSNNPIAKVAVANYTSRNGSKRGTSAIAGVSGVVFEPIDEYKGDIARILLYMSVRFADKFSSWSSPDFNRIKGSDKLMGYKQEYLNMLLQWHEQDPPSQKEKDRNNRVFARQANRNPFIDFPQLVTYVWKTNEDECTAVSTKKYQQAATTIYPNPANKEISVDYTLAKGQNYFITDLSGKKIRQGVLLQSSLSVAELNNGTYFLFIEENGQTSYSKFMIAR